MKVRVSWLHADQAKTTVYDADSYQVHDGVLQVYKGDKQVGTVFSPQEAAVLSDDEAEIYLPGSPSAVGPLAGTASKTSVQSGMKSTVRGPIHLPDPGVQE